MSRFRYCLTVALALAGARIASAQTSSAGVDSVPATSTDVKGFANDILRPGDLVRLRIWREPDLSGEFPVDESGTVVFPKIGPHIVAGEKPEVVRARVVEAYQRYLRNPSIDITPLRRINVLGAVRNPGLYPVDPTMTIADALAAAGGVTNFGNPQKVELVREGQKITAKLYSSTRIADSPIRSGDQLYVPERSWVSRNAGVVSAGITGTISLVIALFIRR